MDSLIIDCQSVIITSLTHLSTLLAVRLVCHRWRELVKRVKIVICDVPNWMQGYVKWERLNLIFPALEVFYSHDYFQRGVCFHRASDVPSRLRSAHILIREYDSLDASYETDGQDCPSGLMIKGHQTRFPGVLEDGYDHKEAWRAAVAAAYFAIDWLLAKGLTNEVEFDGIIQLSSTRVNIVRPRSAFCLSCAMRAWIKLINLYVQLCQAAKRPVIVRIPQYTQGLPMSQIDRLYITCIGETEMQGLVRLAKAWPQLTLIGFVDYGHGYGVTLGYPPKEGDRLTQDGLTILPTEADDKKDYLPPRETPRC